MINKIGLPVSVCKIIQVVPDSGGQSEIGSGQ
jgi:hypothetical protein